MISDETVKNLFEECIGNLSPEMLASKQEVAQFFRGVTSRQWKNNPYPGYACQRHKKVFNAFKVIPEYCFSCYKISILPRNVLELFKLMIVFDNIELPDNNTRKCMLEVRPKIAGTYKGYIFFQSLEEAKVTLPFVQEVIAKHISSNIQVEIKKGCSEYKLAYPDYVYDPNDESRMMKYRNDWKKFEDYVDKNMLGEFTPLELDTYGTPGAPGMEVRDVQVMRTWIAFAASIGDLSYKKITDEPEWEMSWVKENLPNFKVM